MKRLLPILNLGDEVTSKDLVLRALSQDWPLTARRLHTKIESQGHGLSYHAVHKAVRQLEQQGVLKREKDGYLVNMEWVEQAGSLIEGMRANYAQNRPLYLPSLKEFRQGGDAKTFVFENLAKVDEYRSRLQWEYGQSGMKKPYVSMSWHMRLPILYSERSMSFASLARSMGISCHFLVASSAPPDEWCADQYRMQHQFVKTGVSCIQSCDVAVLGDVVTQLYIPDNVRNTIDAMYKRVKDVSEINIPEFYRQVCLAKGDVKFVIMYNPDIADQLRRHVLGHFQSESVAIFDMDGAFIDPMFPIEATMYMQRKGIFNQPAGQELARLCEEFKKGGMERDEFMLEYVRAYGGAIKGKNPQTIESAVHEFLESEGFYHIRRHAARLFYTVKSYKKTVAFTGWPIEFLEALRPMFVFDGIISTTMSTTKGVFDGGVEENMCIATERAKAIQNLVSGSSLKGSLGFGGWQSDSVFLNKVEAPFAVNPGPKLEANAKRRGWPTYKGDDDALLAHLRSVLRGQ